MVFNNNSRIIFVGQVFESSPLFGFINYHENIFKGVMFRKVSAKAHLLSNKLFFKLSKMGKSNKSFSSIRFGDSFILDGTLFSPKKKLQKVRGIFDSEDIDTLEGKYRVFYHNGGFYDGVINNGIKIGNGAFIDTNGIIMIGYWGKKSFYGVLNLSNTKSLFQ